MNSLKEIQDRVEKKRRAAEEKLLKEEQELDKILGETTATVVASGLNPLKPGATILSSPVRILKNQKLFIGYRKDTSGKIHINLVIKDDKLKKEYARKEYFNLSLDNKRIKLLDSQKDVFVKYGNFVKSVSDVSYYDGLECYGDVSLKNQNYKNSGGGTYVGYTIESITNIKFGTVSLNKDYLMQNDPEFKKGSCNDDFIQGRMSEIVFYILNPNCRWLNEKREDGKKDFQTPDGSNIDCKSTKTLTNGLRLNIKDINNPADLYYLIDVDNNKFSISYFTDKKEILRWFKNEKPTQLSNEYYVMPRKLLTKI